MFTKDFFQNRKTELENAFNSVGGKIKEAEDFIKNSQARLAELRGAYAECEENIKKLISLETEDVKVDDESAKEATE